MNDVGPLMERKGVSLGGRSQGQQPAGRGAAKAEALRKQAGAPGPQAMVPSGRPAVAAEAAPPGGAAPGGPADAGAVVEATRKVGEKIDRQTEVLARALEGGRPGSTVAMNGPVVAESAGSSGAGVVPARR
jgi:hypothetical protein